MSILTGIVSSYNFAESAGANAIDATGNGNTLTDLNANVGRSGNFAIFDGTNKQLGAAQAMGYTSGGDITWAMWIQPTTSFATDSFPLDVLTNSGANRRTIFNLTGASHKTPNLYVSGNTFNTSTGDVALNTLYCVIVTIISGTATLYINNVSGGSTTVGTSASSTNFFSLGTDWNVTGGENFDGKIKAPTVWTRGLNSTEMTQYYNGGVPLLYPFTTNVNHGIPPAFL